MFSHYKKQARRSACQAAVGSQVGSGVLWGHSGPLGTARDRSGPLGTARDRSGRLGTARDGSGRLGTDGTARDSSGRLGTRSSGLGGRYPAPGRTGRGPGVDRSMRFTLSRHA